MSEPVVAIVVAAGSGVRLGTSSAGGTGPKALRVLDGVPLVRRSVDALAAGGVDAVVVVISPEHRPDFEAALAGVTVPVRYAGGGAERQDSVRNGVAAVGDDAEVVLVHDAARPMVPASVIAAVTAAVRDGEPVAVPVVPVVDSVRRIEGESSVVVERAPLRAVQTPQGFRADVLREAHAWLEELAREGTAPAFTDDAAICEARGHHVALVPGSRMSMKITEAVDFAVAEALLALGG